MKITTTPVKQTYQIIDHLQVEVDVFNNPYHFELDKLFQMATRINKKRSFLFVSKVLGKHLAVSPQIPLLVGNLLAMRYMEVVHGYKDQRSEAIAKAIQTNEQLVDLVDEIERNPIPLVSPATFIGFAETATALGHAVFSSFQTGGTYIHTTRENIEELSSIINFEEEHSHATSHRVYASDSDLLNNNQEVVLVDDEITTGKTAINIIRTIKEHYPVKKIFTVVSILDWRIEENRQKYKQLEKELNITINAVSLIDGCITIVGEPILEDEKDETVPEVEQHVTFLYTDDLVDPSAFQYASSINEDSTRNASPYLKATGRFAITLEDNNLFMHTHKKVAEYVKQHRKGIKSLVLGTGEFMYLPMKIASYMGEGIYYHSTTRSPIYQTTQESYTIQNKFSFNCPENPGVMNYLYNIHPYQYDEVFIFIERITSEEGIKSLLHDLKRTFIPNITVVIMTK